MIKEIRTIKNAAVHSLDFNSLDVNKLNVNEMAPLPKSRAELSDTRISGIESIDYVAAQAQLAKTMRRVCENDSPIAIDGMGKDRVVLMPLEHFQKLTKKNELYNGR